MMIEKKQAQVANFNIVIGEDEKPMLDYFDTYIFPALISGITRKEEGAEYLLKGVDLMVDKREEYVIVGKLVKRTELEIKSDIDNMGQLIEKDEKHSSAPYSTFVVYLKNHRVVIVPNQKGSPTLASFRATIYYILYEFRRKYNENVEDNKKLPVPDVKIVGIPSVKSIDEVLSDVKKVNELILCFYPLNGDIDFSSMFETMTTDLRHTVGANRGRTILKSPQNKHGIAKVLKDANGTIDPVLKVTTKENSKITLRDYELMEKYNIDVVTSGSFKDENSSIIKETENLSVIEYTNNQHDEIYERNKSKIIRFIPRNKEG